MKLKGKMKFLLFITLFAVSSAFMYGCQSDKPKPEEMATSEAVLAEQKAAEDAKRAEEARKAEEARIAAAEEAKRAEEARKAEEMRRTAEEMKRAAEDAKRVEEATKAAALNNSHKVKKGDCLWTIAENKKVYNDPFKWPLIYKTNRDQIKDPDLIYPDQVFEITRASNQQEINEAIHEAKTRGPWSLWDRK